MLLLFLLFVTAMMISFTPATAVIGVVTAFIVYLMMKKNASTPYTEVASIVGLLVGAGAGLFIYGRAQYVHQWQSLWWIPVLWFTGSLIRVAIVLWQKEESEDGENSYPP